jgi:phenylalanyl-tRNA synthetase alpha chain
MLPSLDLQVFLQAGPGAFFMERKAMSIQDDVLALRQKVLADIDDARNSQALEQVRVQVLGKSGSLTGYLRSMGKVAKEERPILGKTVNQVRGEVEKALEARKTALAAAELEAQMEAGAVDVTLPGRAQQMGTRHLISAIIDEIAEIFHGIGYTVVPGNEVETDYYNFEALNTPPDHPARGMQDTFYVVDRSGAEAATSRRIRRAAAHADLRRPGAHDGEPEAAHLHHRSRQGLSPRRGRSQPPAAVQPDRGPGRGQGHHVRRPEGHAGVLREADLRRRSPTRLRPHYFPFTEPSAEADVSCGICGGKGCRFCKGTGWVEILGCGMVDPNVFGYAGIDPEVYSGFAFGMGVERIACLKYNVPDLRMLLEGDMRFLRQF